MEQDIYDLAEAFFDDEVETSLLETYCKTATALLTSRLRAGIAPADCLDAFVPAAAWTAAAYYGQSTDTDGITSFTAGNFSVTKGTAQFCQLRQQAEQLLAPYSKGELGFLGVAT